MIFVTVGTHKMNLLYDRNDRNKFLDEEKASSSNMANLFRKIYTEN